MRPLKSSIVLLAVPLVSGCEVAAQMVVQGILEPVVRKGVSTSNEPDSKVVVLASYQASADTNRMLRAHAGSKARLSELTSAAEQSDCRAMGPTPIASQLSIPQFISKAINDELKGADLYDDADGATWTGEVIKIVLSTNPLLESGWWELTLRIKSDTGTELRAEVRHPFQVDTDAHKACELSAPAALGPATQALVKNLVSQPDFPSLLRR
jgi:hypothetical protein